MIFIVQLWETLFLLINLMRLKKTQFVGQLWLRASLKDAEGCMQPVGWQALVNKINK